MHEAHIFGKYAQIATCESQVVLDSYSFTRKMSAPTKTITSWEKQCKEDNYIINLKNDYLKHTIFS